MQLVAAAVIAASAESCLVVGFSHITKVMPSAYFSDTHSFVHSLSARF
jgi:hypothetical protein